MTGHGRKPTHDAGREDSKAAREFLRTVNASPHQTTARRCYFLGEQRCR